jgi:hypothetical protein
MFRVVALPSGADLPYYAKLERLARDKHSCLFQKFINYTMKRLITLRAGPSVIKLFTHVLRMFVAGTPYKPSLLFASMASDLT